jgi:hypothetical protein
MTLIIARPTPLEPTCPCHFQIGFIIVILINIKDVRDLNRTKKMAMLRNMKWEDRMAMLRTL